jgi:rhodanese-related sulfurtransferase
VKFIVDNWVLILMALTSGSLLVWPIIQRSSGGGVAATEAVRLINREKGVLIDVSEPSEFAVGHAGGARSIPFGNLEGSKDLPTKKDLPLIVMCPTGARAGRAAGLLRKAGHTHVVALSGGLNAWRDANLPIEKTAAKG